MSDYRMRAGRMALALVLAAGVGVVGCGDDDNGSPTSPSSEGATGVISNNHGHVAQLTGAQVAAGRAVTLDIRGSADHSHMLDLTNDDVVRLQSRQRVERDSSPQNTHTHRVTFN
jgi:hypothetical protein